MLPGDSGGHGHAYPARPAAPRSPSGSPYRDEPYRDEPYRDEPYRDEPYRDEPVRRDEPYRDEPVRRDPDPARRPYEPASSWPAEEPVSWQSDPGRRASAWPEPGPSQGWSQEQQPGYRAAGREQAPDWHVPEQGGWPEQGESLEALPPIAEVHHDWGGRDDQRNWLAPEDEADGDPW
jgi:hypothetical protein